MKKWGTRLIIAGAALSVLDVFTNGKVYGTGGWVTPIDSQIPKLTLPWPEGARTNLSFWLIAAGVIMRYAE